MKRVSKKGYSMIVLVIAIVVILILSVVSISSLQNTRERTRMMNFIFDMNAMGDKVQNYYTEKGTLPTDTGKAIDMNLFIDNLGPDDGKQFKSQLSDYDNENYYYIDLTQIGGITLRDPDRVYIVNEGSLKVYVKNGIEYKSDADGVPVKYFTLTADLVNGQEQYIPQDEDIVIVGNPIAWVSDTKLRVVLPKRSLTVADWSEWKFRWDFGPKRS